MIPFRVSLNAALVLFTAVGCFCCGVTDGFTVSIGGGHQHTHIGLFAFAVGLPVLAVAVNRLL